MSNREVVLLAYSNIKKSFTIGTSNQTVDFISTKRFFS